MPSSASCCDVDSRRRSARMPACTRGCSVLTRPSRHSGKPVRSSTLVTGRPSVCDQRGRPAGGDELDAGVVQAADELVEPGLVVDGDQRALDRDAVSSVRTRDSSVGRVGSTQAFDALASLPGGGPPAPVVWLQPTERARCEPGGPPPDPFAGDRPTVSTSMARSAALIRSCSDSTSSSSTTAPATCATIGPVSTPASTTNRVAPVTLTPYASASRGPCMPGKAGHSAGWVLRVTANRGEERPGRPAS